MVGHFSLAWAKRFEAIKSSRFRRKKMSVTKELDTKHNFYFKD
jgi:hypothetical protein